MLDLISDFILGDKWERGFMFFTGEKFTKWKDILIELMYLYVLKLIFVYYKLDFICLIGIDYL